jgi:hypothetical protein
MVKGLFEVRTRMRRLQVNGKLASIRHMAFPLPLVAAALLSGDRPLEAEAGERHPWDTANGQGYFETCSTKS